MTETSDFEIEQIDRLARIVVRYGIPVNWTDGKSGADAKVARRHGWQKKSKTFESLDAALGEMRTRLATRNPIVVSEPAGPFLLVDLDSQADVEWFRKFAPPPTVRVRSGKGEHLWYLRPEGFPYSAIYVEHGKVTPKKGNYLVAPGARHPEGRIYQFATDRDELARMPADKAWAMVAEKHKQDARETGLGAAEGKIPTGQRHSRLLSMLGSMRRNGMPEDVALSSTLEWNERELMEPYPDREVREQVERTYRTYADGTAGEREAHRPRATTLILDALDDGLATMTRWFPGYEKIVPVGYHVGLTAPGGTGKGLFLVMLARSMAPGRPLLYSGSEDNRDMLKRRLAAAQVPASNFIRVRVPSGETDRQLKFPSDLDLLEEYIVQTNAAVFAYDAGPAHMDEGLDPNSTVDVRSVVDRLSEIAERTGCTIVCVLHPNKSSEMIARDRASGSKAWIDAMRHSLFMVQDDEEDNVRHIEAVKTNIGETGYGWEMVISERPVVQLDPDGARIEVPEPHLEHVGRSKKSVDIILSRDSKQKAVMKWVLGYLADKPDQREESDKLEALILDEIDCKARTVRRGLDSLKKRGKIKAQRVGGIGDDGTWYTVLCMPGEDDLLPPRGEMDGLPGV